MTGEPRDLLAELKRSLRLRNTETGEVFAAPLYIDEHVTEDHAGRVRQVSASVRVDIEGIPGGDYELIDDAPTEGDEPL